MVAINELVELIDMLRAKGVLKFESPELKLELGPEPIAQGEAVGVAKPVAHKLDDRVEAALRKLPARYRDPSLWDIGDQA